MAVTQIMNTDSLNSCFLYASYNLMLHIGFCKTEHVEFYKGKIRDMSAKTELLQEKADDLERVKRYAGAEQIDTIIGKVKEKELMEHQARQNHRTYGAR